MYSYITHIGKAILLPEGLGENPWSFWWPQAFLDLLPRNSSLCLCLPMAFSLGLFFFFPNCPVRLAGA